MNDQCMAMAFTFYDGKVDLYEDAMSVHGNPCSSTRAELYGCVAIQTAVFQIEQEISSPINLEIGRANQRTLDIVNKIAEPLKKISDFEEEICYLLRNISGSVNATYIKTHQDENQSMEDSPYEVQAQIRCHYKAGAITK